MIALKCKIWKRFKIKFALLFYRRTEQCWSQYVTFRSEIQHIYIQNAPPLYVVMKINRIDWVSPIIDPLPEQLDLLRLTRLPRVKHDKQNSAAFCSDIRPRRMSEVWTGGILIWSQTCHCSLLAMWREATPGKGGCAVRRTPRQRCYCVAVRWEDEGLLQADGWRDPLAPYCSLRQEPPAAEPGGVPPPPPPLLPPPLPPPERLICFSWSECRRAHFEPGGARLTIRMSPARAAPLKHEGHPPESIIVMQHTASSHFAPSAEGLPAVQMFDGTRCCRGWQTAAAAAAVSQTSDTRWRSQFFQS